MHGCGLFVARFPSLLGKQRLQPLDFTSNVTLVHSANPFVYFGFSPAVPVPETAGASALGHLRTSSCCFRLLSLGVTAFLHANREIADGVLRSHGYGCHRTADDREEIVNVLPRTIGASDTLSHFRLLSDVQHHCTRCASECYYTDQDSPAEVADERNKSRRRNHDLESLGQPLPPMGLTPAIGVNLDHARRLTSRSLLHGHNQSPIS
jgi:hypothetical protein